MATARTRPIQIVNMAKVRAAKAGLSAEQSAKARAWYPRVHTAINDLSAATGYTSEQIAGVIALYSINQSWRGNWTLALNALLHGSRMGLKGTVDVPARVTAILDHGVPVDDCLTRQPKVRNFTQALLLQDACAIDRWMYRAFGVPEQSPGRYHNACETATRFMARQDGIPAYAEQSLIWCGIRSQAGMAVND
jgi:hypothetical protein